MVWVLLTRSTLTGQSPQGSLYHGYKNKRAYPQALYKQLVREKYVNISTVPCGERCNCQWAATRTGSQKRQWPGTWRARDGTWGRAPGGRQPSQQEGTTFGKEHAEACSTDSVWRNRCMQAKLPQRRTEEVGVDLGSDKCITGKRCRFFNQGSNGISCALFKE